MPHPTLPSPALPCHNTPPYPTLPTHPPTHPSIHTQVAKFIRSHHMPQNIFRRCTLELSKDEPGYAKALLLPATTRFATNVIMAGRLVEVREALRATVDDPDWSAWVSRANRKRREKASYVSATVRDDDGYWEELKKFVDFCTPLISLLRNTDNTSPVMGEVYPWFLEVNDFLREFQYSDDEYVSGLRRDAVVDAFVARWNWCHNPMHACAYALNPRHHGAWSELSADAALADDGVRDTTTFKELQAGSMASVEIGDTTVYPEQSAAGLPGVQSLEQEEGSQGSGCMGHDEA
jgi:hypothetical protein